LVEFPVNEVTEEVQDIVKCTVTVMWRRWICGGAPHADCRNPLCCLWASPATVLGCPSAFWDWRLC